jgi:hypothetical protein
MEALASEVSGGVSQLVCSSIPQPMDAGMMFGSVQYDVHRDTLID